MTIGFHDLVFMALCGALTVVPLALVFTPAYDDGVIGRVGLLLVSFMSASIVMEMFEGVEYDPLPQTTYMLLGFAIYLTWHTVKFYRRAHKSGILFTKRRAKDEDFRTRS